MAKLLKQFVQNMTRLKVDIEIKKKVTFMFCLFKIFRFKRTCNKVDFNQQLLMSCVAKALGVASNKVTVRVKRLGGGFGGKETRTASIAIPTALAALRLGVMTKALMSCSNCYNIPNVYVQCKICKTNICSSTAFRGFGAPQAMLIAETWIDHVSSFLQIDPVKVRKLNLYREGDVIFQKQILEDCKLQNCLDECLVRSDYTKRKIGVEKHNRNHRFIKRGIAVIPTMFGIGFSEAIHLNQAGALVHIYTDGSVLISHGGIEMGQGLHTKLLQVNLSVKLKFMITQIFIFCQIASRVLEIPMKKIHISETSTGSVPNTTATAASLGSDLNGMAVLVGAAYTDRVSLSATGFYKIQGLNFDNQTYTGRPFDYFCNGAACSEVEIDCLTGDHRVIRTDIVMDVGKSLNPSIDIGQIEGAFIQGYGLFMIEQVKISTDGFVYTTGPGSYKVPGFINIPNEFNVSFLQGSKNARAVYSSKAVGEPPLFLSASVFFATKDAISSARMDAGDSTPFQLDSPATPERIRMACKDSLIKRIRIKKSSSSKPWFIDRV
ncbi:hypothetical protein KUTeg_022241 [Tegillarca granosa]|uniref:Xanthine dehydrogenase n=1 Tax=Tegillarca granosa TaxID=220873 RepID=A0ABQ9EA18_TEGGR|nr:hypothetical protein KUTeg_022241 [Tegillarca granosa]